MNRLFILGAVALSSACASGPTPMELAEARAVRLDECAESLLDCRPELGEWADFTAREYTEESLEMVKRIWEFKAAFEEVFGPAPE